MKNFIKELFEYSHHSNKELAAVIAVNANKVSERSMKLFSHVLNTHHVWNHRIEPSKIVGVWEMQTLENFNSMNDDNYKNSLSILDKLDLNKLINYTNTRGENYDNTVRDILFHVINHSSYHRGQIASDFKQCGIEPVITDYIFYKRSR